MHLKLSAKQLDIDATRTYELPEDCQELKSKHIGAIINQ
jgi:hypothetical protein